MNRREHERGAMRAIRGHYDPKRRAYTLDEASSRAWHDRGAESVAINRLVSDIADMYKHEVKLLSADGTVLMVASAVEEVTS